MNENMIADVASLFQWHQGVIGSKYRGNVGVALMADNLLTVGERVFVTDGEWLVVQDAPPAYLDGRRYNVVRPTASIVRCLPLGPAVGGMGRSTEVIGWRNVPADHELMPRHFAVATAVDTAMSTAALSRQTWADVKSDIVGGLAAAGIRLEENEILLNPLTGQTVAYQGKQEAEPVPMVQVPSVLIEDFLDAAIGDGRRFAPAVLGEVAVAACRGQLPQLPNPPEHWRVVNNRPTVGWDEIASILGDPYTVIWNWLASQLVELESGDYLLSARLAGRAVNILPTKKIIYEVTSLVDKNYIEELEAFVLTPPVLTEGWDQPTVRYPGGLVVELAFERDILAS